MDIKEELFKGVSFSDLMSNVYHNSKKKDRQINVTTLIHYCVLIILIWHIFLNHLIIYV